MGSVTMIFFDEVSNKPKRACNKEKRKIGKGKGKGETKTPFLAWFKEEEKKNLKRYDTIR